MPVSADPALQALRKSLGNKAYRGLVKEAHARGFKVRPYAEGKTSGLPEGMIERTTGSLRREAEKTIATAFKPAETALTTAMERETALQSKRERDLLAYQQWSAGQQQRFQQAAMAATSQLLTANQEILGQVAVSRQQQQAAIGAQFAGTPELAAAAAKRVEMDPTAVAARGAADVRAGTAASRATNAAGAFIEREPVAFANQLNYQASLGQKVATEGATRRQEFVDRITELHGKKGQALVQAMSELTTNEQKKVISKYEGETASAIASGKQAFTAEQNALDRTLKSTESAKERSTRKALARSKLLDQQVTRDLKLGLEDDEFLARHGKTREEYHAMTPAQRTRWNTKWNLTKGKADKDEPDALAWTPQEARDNVDKISSAARLIREEDQLARSKGVKDAKGHRVKRRLSAKEIRRILSDEEIPASLQTYVVNLFKSGTDGVLSPAIRAKLERLTGGHAEIPASFLRGS